MINYDLEHEKNNSSSQFIELSARHIPPHVRATANGGDAGEDHDQSLSDRKLSSVAMLITKSQVVTMSENMKINRATVKLPLNKLMLKYHTLQTLWMPPQ